MTDSPTPAAGRVTVKPLEWLDPRGRYAEFRFGPVTICYHVDLVDDDLDVWSVSIRATGSEFGGVEVHKCVGHENAKAGAQSFHESRILSALAAAPAAEAVGYMHSKDNDGGSFWVNRRQSVHYDTPVYAHPAPMADERAMKALPLAEIRRRVRNIWGAVSSDQVVDKDVEGQAKRLLADIDAALAAAKEASR